MFKIWMLSVLSTPLLQCMEANDLMEVAHVQERQKEQYRQQFYAATDVFFCKICDKECHQGKALQDLLCDIEDLTFRLRPKLLDGYQPLAQSSYHVRSYQQEESKK